MEAIKIQRRLNSTTYFVGDILKDESGEYYAKPEADAVIARLESDLFQAQAKSSRLEARCGDLQDEVAKRDHQIEVLDADLTRCQEAKTAIGDKCLRLEGEVERLKSALKSIREGCAFPEDDVQRAIVYISEKALSGGR